MNFAKNEKSQKHSLSPAKTAPVRSETHVQEKIIHQEATQPTPWIAVAALVVSLFTFFKGLYSDIVASQAKLSSKFENDWVSPIRNELRNLEKSIKTLRTFALSNPKSAQDQVAEIEGLRDQWFSSAQDVFNLIREAELTQELHDCSWSEEIQIRFSSIEDNIFGVSATGITIDQISKIASESLCEYNSIISSIRSNLKDQVVMHGKIFGPRGLIKKWIPFIRLR